MLPACLRDPLGRLLQHRRRQHAAEVKAGRGRVMLPRAFARKHPNAELDWAWQWAFAGKSDFRDRETGRLEHHHIHETVMQREDDDDLHARAQPRWRLRSQPGRPIGADAMTAATASSGGDAGGGVARRR